MSNIARTFFEGDLKRALSEWRSEPDDRFRATTLANELNNLVDRLGIIDNAGIPNPGIVAALRASLEVACPEYGIIRDVADGKKHHLLTRPSKSVTSEDQTAAAGAFDLGFDRGFDSARIVVTDDAGCPHEFEDLIEVVMRFFEAELAKRGL